MQFQRTCWAVGLVALTLGGFGCAEPVSGQTYTLRRPTDAAFVCFKTAQADTGELFWQPTALAGCTLDPDGNDDGNDDSLLLGFIANTDLDGLSIIDLTRPANGKYRDPYPQIPGHSRIQVGAFPVATVASEVTAAVYTANRLSEDLARIDPSAWTVRKRALPGAPADLVLSRPACGPETAYVALPEQAAVVTVPLTSVDAALVAECLAPADAAPAPLPHTLLDDHFPAPEDAAAASTLPALGRIALPDGAPWRLAMAPDGRTLYATHAARPYLSVVDVQTGSETRILLARACADGIDNDGDGLTDAADPGCGATAGLAESAFESGAACTNGIDDDGDDFIDLDDPGCIDPVTYTPACADGIDNDGDGLTDLADRGCDHPGDASEHSENAACADGIDNDGDGLTDHPGDPQCTTPDGRTEVWACADGIDNDGDGLTDDDGDPGCAGEHDLTEDYRPVACPGNDPADGAPPACSDGRDNDGDGLIDFPDDKGCTGTRDPSELTPRGSCDDCIDNDGDGLIDYPQDPDCWAPEVDGELHPLCDDGRDNDGDGLTDYPADPGCARRSSNQEADPEPPTFGAVAVSPDGRWVYVADHRGAQVLVVDTRLGRVIDLARGEGGEAARHPLYARKHIRGIPTGTYVTDIAFMNRGAGTVALLTELSGTAVFVEVSTDGEAGSAEPTPQHIVLFSEDAAADPASTIEARPTLEIDGEAFDYRSVIPGHVPQFKPFSTAGQDAAERDDYYGIVFRGEPRREFGETWTVRYEGTLPGSASVGRLQDATGHLHDPLADFCAIGAKPGDLVVLEPGVGFRCNMPHAGAAGIPADVVLADTIEYFITDVGPDGLTFAAPGVATYTPPAEAGSVIEPVTIRYAVSGLPNPACFAGGFAYRVRAAGEWVVDGTFSGFLHNRRTEGRQCVVRGDARTDFAGRATTARLLPGATIKNCPVEDTDIEGSFDAPLFRNLSFETAIYPGCESDPDAGPKAYRLVAPERDLAWSFTVSSGFVARRLGMYALPHRVRALQSMHHFFVVDSSGALVSVDASATESSGAWVTVDTIDRTYY